MAAPGRGSAGSRAPLVAGAAFLCIVAALLAAAPAAEAGTTYFVGDAAGWTHHFDYGKWAAGKTFRVGDMLVFKYNPMMHDVAWVSKAGYKKCFLSPNGAPVYRNGYTTVTLRRAGTHYFICGAPYHCSKGGMKLAVEVVKAY